MVANLLRLAENSQLPFRRRQRVKQRVCSKKCIKKFASVHASYHNPFDTQYRLANRQTFKPLAQLPDRSVSKVKLCEVETSCRKTDSSATHPTHSSLKSGRRRSPAEQAGLRASFRNRGIKLGVSSGVSAAYSCVSLWRYAHRSGFPAKQARTGKNIDLSEITGENCVLDAMHCWVSCCS